MTETVVSLPISGMTCAACAARLEKVLGKLDGVSASVSFASEQAQIRYLPERISPQQLLDSIGKAGFSVPQQALELDITGMTCAACAVRLEKVLNKLPAVQAQVNFANQTARLHFAVGLLQVPDAMAAISKAGFQGRQRQ
ncbi:MAG: heavy-metal-associated domain-containing protein, partial [Aquitalea sp.]|nr:heavy-metal-associated domain-containing protein [Aquitalea sp.]